MTEPSCFTKDTNHFKKLQFIKRVKTKSSRNSKLSFTTNQFYLLQALLNINNVNPVNISTLDQCCFNVAQCQYNGFSTLHSVASTLFQRRYLIISTLFQSELNISYNYIETNLVSGKYEVADILRSFVLRNEKIFFTIFQLFNY